MIQHPQTLKQESYNPGNQRLGITDVTNCIEDHHHHILAISKSGGLYRYVPEKDAFESICNQFPDELDRAFSIIEDATGHIWITTDDALIMLSFDADDNLQYTNYTSEDGLGSMFFQANSAFQFGNQVFLGSGADLVSINTAHIKPSKSNKSPYNIIVTDLLLNEKRYAAIDSTLRPSSLPETG